LMNKKTGQKWPVMLFYEPDYTTESGSKGVICWNYTGTRKVVEGQTMEIHHITDLYTSKQTPALNLPVALEAQDENCFSVIGFENGLDLEADNEERANTWIEGLSYLMWGSKPQILDILKQTKSTRKPKFEPWSLDVDDPTVQILLRGKNWIAWEKDQQGNVNKRDVFVFLTCTGGRLGTLHVCSSGRRTLGEPCIPFHMVTDIVGGKKSSDILSHPGARTAHGSRCLSIVSSKKNTTICIEGQTKEQLLEWATAINYIFQKSGKKVEKVDRPEDSQENGDVTMTEVYRATKDGDQQDLLAAIQTTKPSKDTLNLCLFRAVVDQQADKMNTLLARKASVHFIDAGQTPMHRALMWANMSSVEDIAPVVKILVEAGANLNALDSEGQTPLDYLHPKILTALEPVLYPAE